MASVTVFLEVRLKLKVNRQKSAVAPVGERSFLGHRLGPSGTLAIAARSLARAKIRLRRITGRRRPIRFCAMIAEVNTVVTGRVTFFRHAEAERDLASARPMAPPQAARRLASGSVKAVRRS